MLKFKKKKVATGRPQKPKPAIDPMIEEIVEIEVEFICPVKGKIKQKVKVKRLKKSTKDSVYVVASRDNLDDIGGDDGLSIYEGNQDEDVE